MSDDLLRAADAWSEEDPAYVPGGIIKRLAARVRELEAERDRQRVRNADINDALCTLLHDNIEGMERERIEHIADERDALRAENERLRALLREAQDRSVYLAAPATDDHSISLRERIDAALAEKKP